MNVNEFKSEMAKHAETGRLLSLAMGISEQTFSSKMNGRDGAEWNATELAFFKKRWELNADRFEAIFFA